MYGIVVLLHVLGAFAFVLAHGVSMVASFRLRGERDPARQAQLLELSGVGIGLMHIGLARQTGPRRAADGQRHWDR